MRLASVVSGCLHELSGNDAEIVGCNTDETDTIATRERNSKSFCRVAPCVGYATSS
jgi:hypothetical protein